MPLPAPRPPRSSKRILGVGVYTPGDLAFEVAALADVEVRTDGGKTALSGHATITGHATIRSRFKGQDFSSLYRLSRLYEVRQGRWRIIAAKTARLGDK